jgi:hypothetical protein
LLKNQKSYERVTGTPQTGKDFSNLMFENSALQVQKKRNGGLGWI